MTHLLDTAAWANAVTRPQAMSKRVLSLIASGNVGLSSVSLLEVATLYRLGRLEWDSSLPAFYSSALSARVTVLDLTPAIAAETNELPPGFQGDPFDRTIAATAKVLNLTLITPDRQIRDSKFCRVEFYRYRPGR